MGHGELPSYVRDVLSALPGGYCFTGDGWLGRCPAHLDRHPSLRLSVGEGGRVLFKCRAGCDTRRVLELLGLVFADLTPGRDDTPCPPLCHRPTEHALPDTDIELRDAVYQSLLGRLELSPAHRDALRRRGLTCPEVQRAGYRSLPLARNKPLARALRDTFGSEVDSVPGFQRHRPGFARPFDGMLVPVRDSSGRVVALKIRRDHGSRYCYFGSTCNPLAAPAHVPLEPEWPRLDSGDEVRVTEGELKADVAGCRSAVRTVGLPGATLWPRCLPLLRAARPGLVVVAFDCRDVLSGGPVAAQLARFVGALAGEGLAYALEVWGAEHKGVDDLLAAGGCPERLAGEEASRFLAECLRRGVGA